MADDSIASPRNRCPTCGRPKHRRAKQCLPCSHETKRGQPSYVRTPEHRALVSRLKTGKPNFKARGKGRPRPDLREPFRQRARELGLATYVNNIPCKRGHLSPRKTCDGMCVECHKLAVTRYRQTAEWHAKACLWASRRNGVVRQATPKWADLDSIRRIYEACHIASQTTGVRHDVDHIVPLQGEGVCGLHVDWNLRIVPASVNRSKKIKLVESDTLVRIE